MPETAVFAQRSSDLNRSMGRGALRAGVAAGLMVTPTVVRGAG
jgi:hypothetical protein